MRNIGLDVETFEPEPGRVNVLGILKGYGGGRSLMLTAHKDTVGIEGTDDPFSAEIHSDRMYGRSTQDMKGSLTACLTTFKTLSKLLFILSLFNLPMKFNSKHIS